jgi:hypothetical protein
MIRSGRCSWLEKATGKHKEPVSSTDASDEHAPRSGIMFNLLKVPLGQGKPDDFDSGMQSYS